MEDFRGIILYNIELNGNLNGVYTNNHKDKKGEILNEIAKLRTRTETDSIVEIYDCVYFEDNSERISCTLTFTITNGIINAVWQPVDKDKPLYRGEGFKMNDHQIAIAYWFAT